MGTVVVRALATSPPRAPATITATRRSIKSAANTGNCASWSSAKRYSIARFLPSTKPVSRNPRLKASRTVAASARDRGWRTPTVNCVGCCARAASGQAATEPTVTLMKSRRRIALTKAGTTPIRMRLQQGFAIGEMAFSPSLRAATIARTECPLWVNNGHRGWLQQILALFDPLVSAG